MQLTEAQLMTRVPVWHALSELFTGRELQDYDYRWMAQKLKESGLSREEIFVILDEEVAPALQSNLLYNPTPVMDGWSEEDIKQLVTEYVYKKPTIIERIIPTRLLLKQRRKHIQDELTKLSDELDKCF
ncbi:DUF7079 family protein [Klebsiella aerogenes]|jgi:predicted oxidoreductase (fatty acid repression mutant protein)|uniref:DUF7079 family protein n=1 Tax=Klebsiella aerogenes TaxID=548 RepID=UPI00063C9429|nr:hypothetical protein [Klebsiella aerogenes]EKV7120161.1 hypothetical protein [Klebsiella aerogenes]EKZ9890864.1 hypothetical protein [Klebsiella aerogenes]ELA0416326.1 hypothetical protein [Klebsiella aerogenes]KLE86940.1 hypothetical protein YA21_06720 [Klebsiella aerogenes]KTJ05028.1 hypothetical protein ASU92_21280 [Klebsiella aerogenes]